MHTPSFRSALVSWLLAALPLSLSAAEVTLVREGQPLAAIFAPERLLDDAAAQPEPANVWRTLESEANRRRLRESVRDLAGVLERISGAKIEVVAGAPAAGETRLPILIGELAQERFGPVGELHPYGQGLRIVVRADGLGLYGESDLASSYAIYTLLEQLGCRWYAPSSVGEVLPTLATLSVAEQDLSTGPYTYYRGLWYCDNDFARRNRLGGLELSAGHAAEFAVPAKLREEHPEVRAIIGGQPHEHRVKWTHPLIAEGVASEYLKRLEADPNLLTLSLSPDDGSNWDESDDAAFDAGDFDPAAQQVSKTDRLLVFANRVAEKISPRYPQVKLGLLAYADYIRPPVREKLHPSIVPQIAPITFSRAHPMTDDGEPNSAALRALVEGWGKVAPATSYYFYAYNLAEVSSPNPFMTKWSIDIPLAYSKGNCRYWQPETLPNFETSLHAHHLGLRLAWSPDQDPAEILSELHTKFYGAAAAPMAAYWKHIDEVWVTTPEYSGCGFGHLRRWTPERLARARELIQQAMAACDSDVLRQRVRLADESLAQFDRFMALRRDLADGKFANLSADAAAYLARQAELGEQYKAQYAFGLMPWTGPRTINGVYFEAFYKATYDDASRIAAQAEIVASPLRTWRIQPDPDRTGLAANWQAPDLDDSAWRETDCAVDTWSALGHHNYMGAMWYRTRVALPAAAAGQRTKLWISATDGRVQVWVNGQAIPHVDDKGATAETFSGFCQPVSFDISSAVQPDENQVTLLCTREFLNELGTGGLLSPASIYRE